MSKPLAPMIQPDAIEAESFRIIEAEIGPHDFSVLEWPVVQRAIHATADFELGRSMLFHPRAVEAGIAAIRKGAHVVADVQMIQAGISAGYLAEFGGRVLCYMADTEVAEKARAEGTTRAIQCMRKAAREAPEAIYAIGNAPTALLELVRLVEDGEAAPALIIGVPVGFVSAAESKERLREQGLVPYITNHGRKGGTPVAVAVTNALLRLARGRAEQEKPA
ncbi:MAG: precorrin-8X methylmutase [candidate division NC10 bacterium]|nr:precorrin-8X methylmutase [Candidatus Rokubacteria bacterium]MBI2563069.1 precorrin-8X methylmutase [candidate division NC10 bacterium]